MMLLPTCLRAKSAAPSSACTPDVMHVEGWIEDRFGQAVSIQGRGTTVAPVVSTTTYQSAPLVEFSALDQESVSVFARTLR